MDTEEIFNIVMAMLVLIFLIGSWASKKSFFDKLDKNGKLRD
jgi:uncharacterized protein YneF (UPF0154 family)